MIQSAVVVPEPEEQHQETTLTPSLKRRQSSISSETSSKLPRLSPGRSPHHGSPSAMSPPPQRKPSAANTGTGNEERKRTQRLFGNVFSNLNITSAKPAHRKRDEIEKRQQERLKQQTEEAAEEKKRKREELDAIRRKQQKAWDTKSMHARHVNMRATAQFLKTKTQPHLYYRPWELRPEDEAQIKRQIEEADDIIKQELAKHETANGADIEMAEVHPPVSETPPPHTEPAEQTQKTNGDGETELVGANKDVDTNTQEFVPDATKATNDDLSTSDTITEHDRHDAPDAKPHDDHGGEELVEGQEDDVIY